MFLDLEKTYTVEPKLNLGEPTGLAKEGLSRHVGTLRSFSVAYDPNTKKYRTGLDEFAPEVTSLPADKRKELTDWIVTTRTKLEELIGEEGILNAKNEDFWQLWKVDFEVTPDKKMLVMGTHPQFQPSLYWRHKLALITLYAGGDIPFSKKEASDPRFRAAQFVITTQDELNSLSKDRVKKSRRQSAEMEKLFPSEGGQGDFDRAFSIAYLLNVQKERNISVEKLEEVLEMMSKQPEYIDRFLDLAKMPNDELAIETTIKKACDYGIIDYRPQDKLYFRGGHNFRSTEAETTKYFKTNMADTSVSREFAEIKALVVKQDTKRKK